jgi:hypothetical protein
MLEAAKSAYECEREKRIASNNAILKSLGLDEKPALIDKRPKPAPAQKKRRYEDDPEYVAVKRETRSSGRETSVKYSEVSGDDEDSESASEDTVIRRPVKISKRSLAPPLAAGAAVALLSDDVSNAEGNCVVVEEAKTGRSKCRKCMDVIPAGALRVGMESWIVGRNVITWQHPECFCCGLEITVEVTGRGKCKQTKQKFEAGERRLSAIAHTTTNNFKLSAAVPLLLPVFQALGDCAAARRKAFDSIVRLSELQPSERALLAKCLADTGPAAIKMEEAPAPSSVADDAKAELPVDAVSKQPRAGVISKAKGRVCWRFAGCLCYGTLLPAQESHTTCYARTHKGNTKTLTKGNASWWMLD